MNTIHTLPSLEVGQYRRGDLASISCTDPDPCEGWPFYAEHMSHDMRSIRLDGLLIAVIGYFNRGAGVADSFAAVDRPASAGHGLRLASVIAERQQQWMVEEGFSTVYADCPCKDRVARVFLRAIGYRLTAGELPDTSYFVMHRSK